MRPLGDADREILLKVREVVGVDEVGRGCLAGPVVVAGVAFEEIPPVAGGVLVRDSKTMRPRAREAAARWILANCRDWIVVEVWVDLIDRLNILEATRLAMRSVARSLAGPDSFLVVDHVALDGECEGRVLSCPGADGSYFSVAAASILAKVHRDGVMAGLAGRHQIWQWDRNMGYGTVEHRRALTRYGRSFLHRRSFRYSPVLG